MARNMYGATSADFTLTSGGRVVPGSVLTIWSARTGGTQITDLTDVDSVATTTVTSAADGSVVYYGPDSDATAHWADSGQGSRVAIRPVDITGEPPNLTVGTVTTGTADVTISGTSPDYDIDFVLPPVGTNGVDTAAIQAGAVTTAKLADAAVATAKIADAAVTSAKLSAGLGGLLTTKGDLVARDASTAVRLPVGADGTVLQSDAGSAAGVRWGPVDTTALANGAVTGAKIAADTITAANIAPNAIGASELADAAVDTAALASGSVSDDKVVSGITFTVGPTPPSNPKVGAEWADTSSPPLTVIRKWTGVSWLVWLVTDAVVPAIGEAAWGGYMAGIIDTTRAGVIGGTDPSQVGLRYLLIVSPKSIEYTTGKMWKTTDDAGPDATKTLWDGLAATEAMFAAGPEYEAATYCRGLAFPADGGSRWYLPAKHELEVLYRNFKPTTEPHYNASGTNPASDPTGTAYVPGATTAPAQSLLAAFQQGGAQALEGVSSPYYWSSSEYSAPYAWLQLVGGTFAGIQDANYKTYTNLRVRPVRRFVL